LLTERDDAWAVAQAVQRQPAGGTPSGSEDPQHEQSLRAEQEIAGLRRERDMLLQQRHSRRARLALLASQEHGLPDEPERAPEPVRKMQETNVVELGPAEILTENETEANIHLPRVRPVAIPPPQVRLI